MISKYVNRNFVKFSVYLKYNIKYTSTIDFVMSLPHHSHGMELILCIINKIVDEHECDHVPACGNVAMSSKLTNLIQHLPPSLLLHAA